MKYLYIFCAILVIGGLIPSLTLAQSVGDSLSVSTPTSTPRPATSAPAPISLATPTPLPTSAPTWTGKLVAERKDLSMPWCRLLVQVVGQPQQTVRLSTLANVIGEGVTGQKVELGSDMVEFAGLSPGRYIIEPQGIKARFDVDLKANVETKVVFELSQPSAPPTPLATTTPIWPTYTRVPSATPTNTPTPTDTPTLTATPTETTTPTNTPTATPMSHWLGKITHRQPASTFSQIKVNVLGFEGLPIQLQTKTGSEFNTTTRCITGEVSGNADGCQFSELASGEYQIVPEGLGVILPLTLLTPETVAVEFDLERFSPGIVGWEAKITQNSSLVQATHQVAAIIWVQVQSGQIGQVISLRSARGLERFCEAKPQPQWGLGCQFSGLAAGVYTLEALNTHSRISVFVDGLGQTQIVFSPTATVLATPMPAQVGHGARPRD